MDGWIQAGFAGCVGWFWLGGDAGMGKSTIAMFEGWIMCMGIICRGLCAREGITCRESCASFFESGDEVLKQKRSLAIFTYITKKKKSLTS